MLCVQSGNTALLRAASWGCLEVVQWLMTECDVRKADAQDFAEPYQVTAMDKLDVRRCIRRARKERLMRAVLPLLQAEARLPVKDLVEVIVEYTL